MWWNRAENVTEILGQPKTSLAPKRKIPHPAVLPGWGILTLGESYCSEPDAQRIPNATVGWYYSRWIGYFGLP